MFAIRTEKSDEYEKSLKAKKAPVRSAINTYLGNYCYRKCFNHWDIISDCETKFERLAKEMGNTPITFKEFNSMTKINQIKICKFPLEKRRKYVSWKYFEYLKRKNKDFWEI